MSPALRGLLVGAATATAALDGLARSGPRAWRQRNYRNRPVSLAAGPALAAGAVVGTLAAGGARRTCAATLAAVVPAALAGGYDDLVGSSSARGLRGHLGALTRGQVTTGSVKVAGIGAGGLVAGALLGDSPYDALTTGALVAGCANLVNLLDLRPGRAVKAAMATGLPLLAGPGAAAVAGALGAAAALLPAELGERAMLGDGGANALGGALGVGLAATVARSHRLLLLAAVTALTLASERVSFSAVIDRTAPLRWVDHLGRLP